MVGSLLDPIRSAFSVDIWFSSREAGKMAMPRRITPSPSSSQSKGIYKLKDYFEMDAVVPFEDIGQPHDGVPMICDDFKMSSEMKMSTNQSQHEAPKVASGEMVMIPVSVDSSNRISYGIQSLDDEGYNGMPSTDNDHAGMSLALPPHGFRLTERIKDSTRYVKHVFTDLAAYNECVAYNHGLGEDNGENIAVITDESLYKCLEAEEGFKEPDTILGSGSFGTCTKRRYTDKKRNIRVDIIVKEIKIMDLNRLEYKFPISHPHPGITKVHGFMEFPKDKICRLFMENGGTTLKEFRQGQTNNAYHKSDETNIMRQILEVMKHIHALCHIYLDLKPANILVEIGIDGAIHIRLCDFGAILHDLSGKIITSPKYQAPECHFRGIDCFSDKTDMFTCGGVLYFLISGKEPWGSVTTRKDLKEYHLKMRSREDVDEVLGIMCPGITSDDSPLYNLMVSMLDGNPKRRPSARQALDIMNELEINMAATGSRATSTVSIPLGQTHQGAAHCMNVASNVLPDFGSISDASRA
ncbi:unnamed protein product [Owenia fusiformis]|uniref:Protein kinase domain-containing protein n=1 Tax=Owenia fusiformis TaxID=6347 RepID=A0A8S4P8Q7_OWEFU|nr:unnamed protein product [Owenia fusiformis]